MKPLVIAFALFFLVAMLSGQAAEPASMIGLAVDNCPTPEAGHSGICAGATDVQKSINGGPWQPIGTITGSTGGGTIPSTFTCNYSAVIVNGMYALKFTNCH